LRKVVSSLALLLLAIVSMTQFAESFNLQATSVRPVYTRETSSEVFIGNGFLEIGFRKECGAIWSFIHRASGVDLRGIKNDLEGLWDVMFLSEDYRTIGPSGLQRSRPYYNGYSINQTVNEMAIRLEWRKVQLEGYGEYAARLIVSVKVTADSPFAKFCVEIENSGLFAVEYVAFPLFWEVSALGNQSSDDKLLIPSQNGRIFNNPIQNLKWYGNYYPSALLKMQFLAYYDSDGGFYFATYDTQANTKFFFWQRLDPTEAIMAMLHYPTIKFGEDFYLGYDVMVGVFTGDWYAAADIYKQWANNQWWCIKKETPAWLREVAVSKDFYCYTTFEYRNRTFAEAVARVTQHQQYFDLPTLVLLWGWERRGAWSSGDYFPPYEGWQKFDELMQAAHECNSKLWLFLNARAIIMDSEQWKNGTAKDQAIVNRMGPIILTQHLVAPGHGHTCVLQQTIGVKR
jgi:hypothetical protein